MLIKILCIWTKLPNTKSVGKESTLIITHISGGQGFVPNALQIWQSKNRKQESNQMITMDFITS